MICRVALLYYALFPPHPVSLPPELKLESGDMALVPGGPALLGAENRKVELPPFYIDKTEASNRAYAEFLRKTARGRPKDFREDRPDYPVVNVTFYDAREFARW